MTFYEIISLIISVVGLIVAFGAVVFSWTANKSAKASIELSMYNAINSTKETIMTCSESMETLLVKKSLSEEEQNLLELKKKRFNVAVENNLNAYEEACAKYIDKKIDCCRFKKAYLSEIQNIVQNKDYVAYFNPVTSKYKAILKVYEEWFNLEK